MAITTSPAPGTFKYPRWTDSSQNELNKRLSDVEKFINVLTGFTAIPTPTGVGNKFLQGSTSNTVQFLTTLDQYESGSGASLVLRSARGLEARPSESLDGDLLGSYSFSGRGDAGWGFSFPGTYAFADEDWVGNAQGAYVSIFTTPTGHVAASEAARFTSDGQFLVDTAALTQTYTQSSAVSGAQGMPLHLQLNAVIDYPGAGGLFGGPQTAIGFVGATYDGLNPYPDVMQGPRGMVQIDGLTTYHYSAGGSQAPPIFQTANTWTNGPRTTLADVHLTNGSPTITSASAAFTNGSFAGESNSDTGAMFTADVAGVPANCTLTYVNATTATMSGNFTGTTTTTARGSIWRKINLPGAALFNNSPSWVARNVECGITYEFTVSAPGIQDGYGNPSGIYGFADDQYFSAQGTNGFLNCSSVSGGTDQASVGFWSLPVWNGNVHMAARYDFYSSEAYIAADHLGNTPVLDYHVAFYAQSMRRATKNHALVANAPIVGYNVDSVYSSALFKDAGTAFGGAFISVENAYTLDFPTASFGALLQFSGTVRYRQDASLFGAGVMIQNVGTYKNNRRVTSANGHTTNGSTTITSIATTSQPIAAKFTSGDVGATISGTGIPAATTIASVTNATTAIMSAAATATNTNTIFAIAANVSITSITGTSMEMTFLADGRPTTFAENIDFRSSPHYSIANSGSFTGTTGSTGFDSALTLGAGVGLTSRSGVRVHDVTLGAGATINLNYGIFIEDQTAGSVLNYGIYNLAPTLLGTLSVDRAGVVGGTHNLVTTDGVRTTVTSALGDFGVKYTSNSLGANLTIDRIRTTGGVLAAGDIVGGIYFRGAGNAGASTMVNVSMVRGVTEQATSLTQSGGRVEIITTPNGSTTLALAAIVDNAKSFHLAPTLDGTTQLVNASGFAVKSDGTVWVAPSAYTTGQPTAAAATISALGAIAGLGLALGKTGSYTASFNDISDSVTNTFNTTASMVHRFAQFSATDTWTVAPLAGSMFFGFQNAGTFQNGPSASVNLGAVISFQAGYTKQIDTQTGKVIGSDTDFQSGPVYQVANSGTFTSGTHTAFQSALTINATGSTLTTHTSFTVANPTVVAGTLTTHVGLDIAALSGAGTNIGIRNKASTQLGSSAQTVIDNTGTITTFAGLADAVNIVVGSTTGTQIGTATGQKIGFHGTTPVVQSATASVAPAGGTGATAGAYDTAAHRDTMITLVNAMRTCLRDHGLMA